jgi:hypothetical protein
MPDPFRQPRLYYRDPLVHEIGDGLDVLLGRWMYARVVRRMDTCTVTTKGHEARLIFRKPPKARPLCSPRQGRRTLRDLVGQPNRPALAGRRAGPAGGRS